MFLECLGLRLIILPLKVLFKSMIFLWFLLLRVLMIVLLEGYMKLYSSAFAEFDNNQRSDKTKEG